MGFVNETGPKGHPMETLVRFGKAFVFQKSSFEFTADHLQAETVALAERHGLVPILWNGLRHSLTEAGTPVLENLRQKARTVGVKNLLFSAELLRVLDLFAYNGIEAVPYKGPSLAAELYGDVKLRQFSDLDVFFRKEDFHRVKEVLTKERYRPHRPLTRLQEEAFLRNRTNYGEYNYFRDDNLIYLEMHWSTNPGFMVFPVQEDDLWKNLRRITFLSREIPAFSPENLLMILSVHGFKHRWNRLCWLLDLALLLRKFPRMDVDLIRKRIRDPAASNTFLTGVLAAEALFGPLGETSGELSKAARPKAKALAEETTASFLGGERGSKASAVFFHASAHEGALGKCRYICGLLGSLNTEDLLGRDFPRRLAWAWYPLRWLRIGREAFFGEGGRKTSKRAGKARARQDK
jgi:hypothetical protein